MILTVDNSVLASKEATVRDKEPVDYLKPTDSMPSDDPALSARKSEIIGNEKNPEKIIEKLASWITAHVKDTSTASESPLDTIRKGEGDCLARARLYSALARAAGIPTRIVLGLAYIQDRGFLYHCWAESYSGKWLPVDPTSGEVPADATHLKLVEGDTAEDLVALSEFVGKIKAKVVEQKQAHKMNSSRA
jgi:transglutaminase-like putative cysteine protease